MLNPIAPPGVYIADPEVRKMPNGKIFLYGSKDDVGNQWCSNNYNVLSTDNLVEWNMEQTSFATEGVGKQTDYTTQLLYAPDCIEHNGKYYLYYCLATNEENEGVAVSDSPYGPFKNGQIMKGAEGIDPSVFIDDDGQAYLFWGQANVKGAKLSQDMKQIAGPITEGLLTYKVHKFNEGSSVRKHNGIYYFVYASHVRHGESNCATLCYATSTSPLGPYTYGGVIIDNWGSGRNLVNNHGCIEEIDGQWYVFYHRPTHASSTMRKACMEPIFFEKDGTIREVEMTTQGAGGPIDPTLRMEAARACLMDGNVFVQVRRPANDIPVEFLKDFRTGDHAVWRYFDFTGKNLKQFTCKTWGNTQDAIIEIRIDGVGGQLLGTVDIAAHQEETAYAIHTAAVQKVTGIHAIYLVVRSKKEQDKSKDLLNLEWFEFGR
ncbi:family 43 glycosylhydrolase [Sphingobacterium paludis]|nr:family 43 glycosylhydrolase [Sphingobacterium paludis]